MFDFLRARADGHKVVAFASAYTRSPIVFYARQDSNIRSVTDIMGKAIAYDRGTPAAIVFDALLAKNNLSQSSLKLIPNAASAEALKAGQIDILPGEIGKESHLLDQLGQPFYQLNPSSYGIHLPGSVYFTTEETLRAQPDVPRRFLFALARGWERIYQKMPEDLAVLADALQLPQNLTKVILDEQRAFLRPSGIRPFELDTFYMKSVVSLLVQQRLIKTPLRLADALDLDAVGEASRQRW
ncbi:ABC transporter substrate-binding protein [Bradyrhizobium sp. RDM12]